MKIALINGQNHKGSTYHIGRLLAEKLTLPNNISEIFLPKDMPYFCCGCTQCFMNNEKFCPHSETLKPLTKIIDEADVLIFTSPVYVFHATGSMKAFLDHYGYRWMLHRPEEVMFKKQAVVISTAAGGGMKSTCKDISDSCYFWGVAKTYKFGIAVYATKWDSVSLKKKSIIDKKTDTLAMKVSKRVGKIKPGIKTKAFFYLVRMLQKKGLSPADMDYWAAKGWNKNKKPW